MSGIVVNGTPFTAARTRLLVGRADGSDIAYFDRRVSNHHGMVTWHPEQGWVFTDTASRGGTWRAGTRVTSIAITGPVTLRLADPDTGPLLTLDLAGSSGATSLVLGRDESCAVVLDDLLVSRRHVRLQRRAAGGWDLEDLGSSNGTFVDGQQVERASVLAGQRLTVGRTELVVTEHGVAPVPATQADTAALRCSDVSVVEGGRTLLHSIDLAVRRGELLAIAGPSGAGKSTLLRALSGVRRPDRGDVLYGGRSLYEAIDELRRTAGSVPQDDVLHTALTVNDALAFTAQLRFPSDVDATARQGRIDEVLAELGLAGREHQRIDRLSGGQRKRVSVATELLTRPPLLFLDEPTSGLDPGNEAGVTQLLRGLTTLDRTVVVVTHSVEMIERCDRVLLLAAGGTVAYLGPPADALAAIGQPTWPAAFDALEKATPRAVAPDQASRRPAPSRMPMGGDWWRQTGVIVRRQLAVLRADVRSTVVSVVVALGLALLVLAITAKGSLDPDRASGGGPRTLLVFLVVAATVIGSVNTLREVVKELPIYRRERAAGLDPRAYVLGKMAVFGALTIVQCVVLTLVATRRAGGPTDAIGLLPPLLELAGIVALIGLSTCALGLLLSAVVRTSETAMALVPAIFVVEWLLSGGAVDLSDKPVIRELGYLTSANWGFAASGSSVDLTQLPGACGNPAGGLRCDNRWTHDVLHLVPSLVWLIALTVLMLLGTWVALLAKDPMRSLRTAAVDVARCITLR